MAASDQQIQTAMSHNITDIDEKRLKSIFAYIDAHLEENLTVEHMAQAVNVSPSCFFHIFKKATGLTACEYVNQQRIAKAKDLLLSDKKKDMAQIAICTGFSDQPHFTRHFKRIVGITPGEFRRLNKNTSDLAP